MPTDNNRDNIRHEGVVVRSVPSANLVEVKTDDAAKCGSCAMASMCAKINPDSNLLSIHTPDAAFFNAGDKVVVVGTELMHKKAVMLATVIPCIILTVVMAGTYALCHDQGIAALCGLGCMILFFVVLWLMRNRVRHVFSLKIRKNIKQ